MAAMNMDGFLKEFNRQCELTIERRQAFDAMEDGILRDYICDLLANNNRLRAELTMAKNALGDSSFNQVHI